MRFTEFKIITEAAIVNIVVVGDSIAVGIGQAIKGAVVNATVGIGSSKILSNVSSDSTVQGAKLAIVSAGSNDIVKGKGDPQKLIANIAAIKDALNAEKYVWILPYDKVASEAVSKAIGGDKTVDLKSYPSSDGLHPSNYNAVATAARAGLNLSSNAPGAPRTKDKQGAGTKPAEVLSVPTGRQGPEVADVQKALLALGFKLPQHGVDGVRGSETVAAVKEFQQANGLVVDGDPGPETIAALNKVVANKGIKIEKSTAKDVKVSSGGQASGKLPPLKMDSATSGKVGDLLNFIARYESGGDYNIMVGGKRGNLTGMTVGDVLNMQKDMIAKGHESTAVGRYQYIRKTLAGTASQLGINLDSTKFDEKTQDALAIQTLRTIGLESWLDGKLDDGAFLNKVARVWASVPTTSGGSYYSGVGSNKAGIKTDVALNTLQDIRTA
jgi:peptidoglycan hydrolase-like protein with peptidoglycan-binding domain/lysophospholipase L1-like esterase